MQETNNLISSPNRVVFDAYEPTFEVGIVPVVIAVSQCQFVNIIIRINIAVI